MEDDELFLDDEELADLSDKPKPKSKSKSRKTPAAAKSAPAKQVKKPVKSAPAPVVAATADTQSVSLVVASVLVIAAFVIGFVVGGLVLGGGSTPQSSGQFLTNTGTGGTLPGGTAPAKPLTQQQLQKGVKGLPKGHPQIPGATGGTTTPKAKTSK